MGWIELSSDWIVLDSILSYCIVLLWIGLSCIGLGWIVLDWIVLSSLVLYCIVVNWIGLDCLVFHCIVS